MNVRIEMSSLIYTVLRNATSMAFLEGRKEIIAEVLSAMKTKPKLKFVWCFLLLFFLLRSEREGEK